MIQSRLCALGLFLYSLSWILADHYSPWDSFHSEALSLIAIFILFTSLIAVRNKVIGPKIVGWIVFVGLLPWFHYATGTSIFSGDALLASLYFSGLLLALLFGYAIATDEIEQQTNYLMSLAHAIWLAALISAAIGLVQWLQLTEPLNIYVVQTGRGARALGNLAQPNQLATLLLMGLAALAYVYEKGVIGKLTFILTVIFITAVLVMTQSRAGMISVLVISSFLVWKQKSTPLRLSRNEVIWWVIGFIFGTILLPNLSDWLMLGDMRNLTATESVSERLLIWKQMLHAIAQAPWFGYGWNQTPMASAVGALAFPGAHPYTNAHNITLDLIVWCGIPIGLLLTGIMTYWLVSRLRKLNRPDTTFAMAGLLPIAVHSMLEFPFSYAYFLLAAGFMVGIVEAGHIQSKRFQIRVTWLWGFIAAWTVIGSYMAYEYFLIEEDFRVVRFENSNLGATPDHYEVPNIWMLSHMASMLKAARQSPEPNMSKADIENLRKAAERFIFGTIRCRYAMALALNDDPATANQQLAVIRGMYGAAYRATCEAELNRRQVKN